MEVAVGAATATAAAARHGVRAAAAAVVRRQSPPRGLHGEQRAIGLAAAPSAPMPGLLARRGAAATRNGTTNVRPPLRWKARAAAGRPKKRAEHGSPARIAHPGHARRALP